MGRHLKLKTTKTTDKKPDPPVDEARSQFERASTMLDGLLSAVEATVAAGEITPALVREAASVSRVITTMAAERRIREAMERRLARDINVDSIMAYARSLERRDRLQLIRKLEDLDAITDRSGLA